MWPWDQPKGQPLSARLPGGLRFVPPPLPAASWASLASRCPAGVDRRETTGLPRSARAVVVVGQALRPAEHECGLGHVSPPVARHLRWGSSEPPRPGHIPFLVQAIQQLALVLYDDGCDVSPELTMPHDPGSRPPSAAGSRNERLAVKLPSIADEATLLRKLRTSRLLTTHVPLGDCWQNNR